MEPEFHTFNDGIVQDFPYRIWLDEKIEKEFINNMFSALSGNFYKENKIKKQEPFIVIFRSKPIQRNTVRINRKKSRI